MSYCHPNESRRSLSSSLSTQDYEQRRSVLRRTSVVNALAASIETEVDSLIQNSCYLSRTVVDATIPTFHRYEVSLGALLGEGAFSEVHEISALQLTENGEWARSTRSKRRRLSNQTQNSGTSNYAMKHLKSSLISNPEDFRRAAVDLIIEARYLTALNHPNIIKVRGLAKGGTSAFHSGQFDEYFIVMERLYETLDHRIQRWRDRQEEQRSRGYLRESLQICLRRKSSYALQIVRALEYLHQRRIIFRDLKPTNIGFKDGDIIQLFDFGLCRELPTVHPNERRIEEPTFLMSGVGTRRYMASEVVTSGYYNCKADVYSWAIVFYEMLTLNKPYSAFSSEEHKEYVCRRGERPSIAEWNLPPLVQGVLIDSWAQDVSQRLTMRCVRKRMEAVVADADESASQYASIRTLSSQSLSEEGGHESKVVLEFPTYFQHLLQDCEILSDSSELKEDSCMGRTLTTNTSTTGQDCYSINI